MADFDYQKAKIELNEILAWFESDDITIDEALEKYKKAEQIIKKIEDYLKNTKLKIDKITGN
jgi:exodeoxyribonuclease VII small subunit